MSEPEPEVMKGGGLWSTLQEFEDGSLGEEECAQLMKLVERSDAARAVYLEYFEQSALLRIEADTHIEKGTMPVMPEPRRYQQQFRRSVLAAAAVLALMAAIAAFIVIKQVDPPVLQAVVAADSKWMIDGEWQDGTADDLTVGEGSSVQVLSGMIELKTESGAHMLLQGPAHVTFLELGHPKLNRGWLWVDTGDSSESFEIETPELLVRDIGTRFGVRVRESGLAEVHVVEGEVEVMSKRIGEKLAGLVPDLKGFTISSIGEQVELPLARDPFPDLESLMAALPNYSSTVMSQAPVGYWRLNEDQIGEVLNELPDGAVGRHGLEVILEGDGVGGNDGFYGFEEGNRSVTLDGSSDKSTLHQLGSPDGVSKEEGAVAFWFRRLEEPDGEEVLWFAGKRSAAGLGPDDAIHAHLTPRGRVRFFMENGRYDVLLSSTRSVADGDWHHVVASWGRQAVELYVDGRRVARDDEYRSFRSGVFGGTNVRFGKTASHARESNRRMPQFTGGVDEIALWNRALTFAEVDHQFQSALGTKEEEEPSSPTGADPE